MGIRGKRVNDGKQGHMASAAEELNNTYYHRLEAGVTKTNNEELELAR